MASIVFDAVTSRFTLPTWRIKGREYPGEVTLEGVPWRGRFRSWLRGVSRPLDWEPNGPISWEEFSEMKHYRVGDSLISIGGDMRDVVIVDTDRATLITGKAQLRRIWEDQCDRARVIKVSESDHTYEWYPNHSDPAGLCLHFSRFWKAVQAHDDARSMTVTFKPSLLAQIRHAFSLKPFTLNRREILPGRALFLSV